MAGGAVYRRSDDGNSRPSSVPPSTTQTARGIGLAKISDEVESIFEELCRSTNIRDFSHAA